MRYLAPACTWRDRDTRLLREESSCWLRNMDALSNAIDDLYRAFADVATPRHIDGCPCCIDDKRLSVLIATPLRDLAPDDLASYASSALLTVGDVSDYLHFLPRILEISIRDISWWPDIEVTARAICSTDLQSWPPHRRQALLSFLDAVVDHIIDSGSHWRIDDWLCAIARMALDVRPYLARIERNPAAVLEYFEDNAECLQNGALCNPFWELPNENYDAIVQWFRSEAVRKIPFEAYGYRM
jgi:hypothetical protein